MNVHPLAAAAQAGRRLARLMGRFRRDRRGAYAIEFGLVALPFIGLICATIELSWVSFNAEQLQAAVSRASRAILTGEAQAANIATSNQFVSQLLCPTDGTSLLPSTMDCSKLLVDVRQAASFDQADTGRGFYTQPLQYCLGAPSTVVVVRVAYPMDAVLPLSIFNQYVGLADDVPNAPGWKHVLMGSAAFQTEPFNGSSSC